jgi:hypothetical protein
MHVSFWVFKKVIGEIGLHSRDNEDAELRIVFFAD